MRIPFTHGRLLIYEIEDEIVRKLTAIRRLVLQAPTGSGKSTQVPQMLLRHGLLGNGQLVILQPRRLAARLLASRVAYELGVELGREVGYQVRFENATSGITRIKFETEGILLRQLIQDPALRGIQALIFDEFHERHIFMPGGYEINQTIETIRRRPESKGHLLLPLHGELAPRDQDAGVARYDQPKVVVATNVAETSITIDGVRLVIDSGLARVPRYDPNRGINTLLVEKISRASAEQRAGRAGRTAPGHCIRLWSEPEHAERPAQELPEVKRLDLSEVILTLKAAGVEDLRKFRWLEAPGDTALNHAEELLIDLGALKHEPRFAENDAQHTSITALGRRMLAFPVHPRYARMFVAAQEDD